MKQLLLIALCTYGFAQSIYYDPTSKLTIADEKDAPKLSWTQAKEYCQELNLGGIKQWRLPTMVEMVSFEDRENKETFLKKELKHTHRYDYWSGTQDAMVEEYAWSQGLMYKAYNHTHNKKDKKYVRCVYSQKPTPKPYYIRYKNIVLEITHNILWQDTKSVESTPLVFTQAKKMCQELVLDGFDDWEVPDITTLRGLVDYEHFSPSIDPAFRYTITKSYYSSTPYKDGTFEVIGFNNGIDGHIDAKQKQYVRCVQKLQPSQTKIKINIFFNYDQATLYIDGKRWGKLHTLLDDYQCSGEIEINTGIHELRVVRISEDGKYEISGIETLKLTTKDMGKVINILASQKRLVMP
jgi:hypothetical protein